MTHSRNMKEYDDYARCTAIREGSHEDLYALTSFLADSCPMMFHNVRHFQNSTVFPKEQYLEGKETSLIGLDFIAIDRSTLLTDVRAFIEVFPEYKVYEARPDPFMYFMMESDGMVSSEHLTALEAKLITLENQPSR